MKLRIRTSWIEIAAGFHLLFAAVAAETSVFPNGDWPSWAPRFVSTMLLFAACAVFLLHALRSIRRARQTLFAFASLVCLPSAWWFAVSGRSEFAVLQAAFGLWFACAAFLRAADPMGIRAEGEHPPYGIALFAAVAYAATAVVDYRHADIAVFSAATALLLFAAEWRGDRRLRLSGALAAFAFGCWSAAGLFARGEVGFGGAAVALPLFLLLAVAFPDDMPERADDLAETTSRQREIYAYERAGEATLWGVAALSVAYVNFLEYHDERLYFLALALVAAATQYGYRFRPAKAISERRYLFTLLAVIVASLVLVAATGGVASPFMYFSYLAVFAGTTILAPSWSIGTACVYVAYVLVDVFARTYGGGSAGGAPLSQALFFSATLLLTGLYAAWTGRKRGRVEETLMSTNRQLADALRAAVREREQSRRQADDLKSLNDSLLEMRSALMNVLEDVEESKREIELDRRRESASFNALAEGVVATEKDGRIFLCNPTAARILGVDAKDVIGKGVERVIGLFQEDGNVLQTEAFETAFAGRPAPLGQHLMLAREDGGRVPVSGTVAPYFDEGNKIAGVVVAFRDVTVEREIDRQKSDFISIASHQLRTPLSAMRWFLDLLLAGDAGPLKPEQREYLTDMSTSVQRMVKLVGDLLSITRIESGRIKPNPERMDLPRFIDGLAKEFAPLVKEKGVTFTHRVDAAAGVLYADPSLIAQAVGNIISNAIKYTASGGRVSLSVRHEGDEAVFEVRDTGVGIPKNQQYRVFDKFFRAENVMAKETVGSGLGLYVTKMIVEMSGGRIWFESAEGKGTAFFVALPLTGPGGMMAA